MNGRNAEAAHSGGIVSACGMARYDHDACVASVYERADPDITAIVNFVRLTVYERKTAFALFRYFNQRFNDRRFFSCYPMRVGRESEEKLPGRQGPAKAGCPRSLKTEQKEIASQSMRYHVRHQEKNKGGGYPNA